MKILISCLSFQSLTGSELYVFELSKELVKRGHEVTVLSNLGDGFLEKKARQHGVKCVGFNTPFKHEFDILHLNHTPVVKAVINTIQDVPAVCTIHSEVIPDYESPVIHDRIYKYIAIRPEIKMWLLEKFKIPQSEIELVYNPINVHKFTPASKKPKERTAIFVGTVDNLRRKTILKLIDDSQKEGFRLMIVGKKIVDDYLPKPLPKGVSYHEPKYAIEEYYKQATETHGILLGRTSIEGWHCGLHAYMYDVDKDGNIINVMRKDPPADLNRFDSRNIAHDIEAIYEETIKKHRMTKGVVKNDEFDFKTDSLPIFCINLKHRTDRWENAQKEFERLRIKDKVIRWEATYGKDLVTNEADIPMSLDGTKVNIGDLGCTHSHLRLCLYAKASNFEGYFVLEDDCEFHPHFQLLFETYMEQVPDDADIIYLGGSHVEPLTMITKNVGRINRTYTTHAMIIRNTSYDALIQAWSKSEKVDICVADIQKKLKCYAIVPSLVWQINGHSDILNREVSYPHLR